MEFELKLTKEDIEMMLSDKFGHDVQLEHLIVNYEGETPTVIDFDSDYTYMAFLLTNRKSPKTEVKYNDTRDYSMD